ncbi:MAG: sensor histidine kinase [Gracilibacteraceae bacterium]|jgi:signal transduction histidine kinase|nr:sensor histidine kinase [Gracilibacteraceae bacterium]
MKKHRNNLYIFVFLAIIVLMWSGLIFVPDAEEVDLPAAKGVHDLSAADFENTVYYSKDYWESWPERLYTPGDFASGAVTEPPLFLASGDFARIQFATHRLTLRLPPGKVYGLSMTTSDFAMRLFIDGAEIDSVGVPGATREETVPRVLKKEYYFSPQTETTELVVQAANFVHREGAWYPSFYIGSAENIAQRAGRDAFFGALIFGCLIAMALDHMALFVLNRKWKSALLFSVCCFLMALMSSKKFLFLFFPQYNWFVAIRVEYVVHFAVFFMLTLFLHTIFPRLYHKPVIRAYLVLCGLYCLTLFWDTPVFTSLLQYFEYASAAMIAYTLIRLALAALRERKSQNTLAFFGVFGVCFLAVNDMLYHQGIGWLGPLTGQEFTATIGMMFFAVCYSLLISVEYTETERAMLDARENEARLTADNEALDRVNRMKNDLMANLTHELRTPLMVMSAYAQLTVEAARESNISEQAAADLELISGEAKRLADMASGVLRAFEDKETGVGMATFSMETVIRQVGRLAAPMLSKNRNTLTLDIDKNLPPVLGRPEECTQLIWNLLSNAAAHTKDGVIAVRAVSDTDDCGGGPMLAVAVSDNGEGVSPELLSYMFQRRRAGTRESAGDGAGIGLAICREIVEAHGGGITMENGENGGVTVRFTLPVAEGRETI